MASAAPAAKAALVSMMTTALSAQSVRVFYGHPGFIPDGDIVAVTNVIGEQEPGPLRAAPATREETLRLIVVVSCYRGGGTGAQQAATERAFALLALVESAIRTDVTLGGTVRMAQVESFELDEPDDPDILAKGRVAEISVVVRASQRV